jgi:hypothetical protein
MDDNFIQEDRQEVLAFWLPVSPGPVAYPNPAECAYIRIC